MKTQLQKKLFAFITIIVVMFSFATAKAQIVYTDVNPDETQSCPNSSCSKSYLLDLNKDGTNDFSLDVISVMAFSQYPCNTPRYSHYVRVAPLNPNLTASSKLALNEIISENNLWSSYSQTLRSVLIKCNERGMAVYSYYGDWTDQTDGFLALKITVNNQVYYGWARLSVTATSFVLKDYAYNSLPNQTILAGEGSLLSTDEFIRENKLSIYPNPTNSTLNLKLTNNTLIEEVIISDLTGKKILDQTIDTQQINTELLTSGLYIIQVYSEGNKWQNKFIKN
jgi:hypothetical protein